MIATYPCLMSREYRTVAAVTRIGLPTLLGLLAVTGELHTAPVPFPKPPRALAMAGTWDVKWGSMDVRLELRPDRSARFTYVNAGGTWDGSWMHDPKAKQLGVTLMIDGLPR